MPTLAGLSKRLLLGRALRSDRLRLTLLPKRIALPVFASDALSSVAYAPDEIFLTLALGGVAAYTMSWKVGIAVAIVMITVVASYRQNVHAYPSGGGDYEIATVNLGRTPGMAVAAALLVDYVLTVAVSISSAAQYTAAALPFVRGEEVVIAVGAVVVLMAMNLRGVRESGRAFAIPTYVFMVAILGMTAWGWVRYIGGELPLADSAEFDIAPSPDFESGFLGLAAFFVILRAFSSGSAALTGVEAISNGVPAFRPPKSRNAATTLLLLGIIAVTMLMSIIVFANIMKVRLVENPAQQLLLDGEPVGSGYQQDPLIGQLARGIFDHFPPAFYLVAAATGIILVLAANTAFNGFPVLASILGRDGFLPRQLHTRGDRLAFSNGIMMLAGAAIILIIAFNAEVTRLIQLYIVGVFFSFTMSQLGMVRHWTRHLAEETRPEKRRKMKRSRVINTFGFVMTAVVLLVVLITKFTHGAWITILAMGVLFFTMRAINGHYETVSRELALTGAPDESMFPSRVHAIVLVSKIHKPTMRALAYARAARPNVLQAVTVSVDPAESREIAKEWDRLNIPVPLKVLDSPFREITRPIVEYVKGIRRASPRDVVTVYIPEYVVGHWWEHFLHNQSALRLKGRLLFTPGVMVTSVPWQLQSSRLAAGREEGPVVGSVRRGGPRPASAPKPTGEHKPGGPPRPDGRTSAPR